MPASGANPPDPIAISFAAGLLPALYLEQSTNLSTLLWQAVKWALRRTGILRSGRRKA